MTAFVDPAFRVVRLGEAAFFVWRIEKLEVRPVPKDHHGSFYDGDSYIVYSAAKQGNDGGKAEMHIHFWLGADSTSDEAAAAAIKTVELDDHLGGAPVQHREVQGFESARFMSYFKNGITVLKGGVASGLRHVTHDFSSRLFQVKGRRYPVMTQLAPVAWSHFNSGDCFILETHERIFNWIGKESNKMEKLQAAKVAMQLREARPEAVIVIVDEDAESGLFADELRDFQSFLPLSEKKVQPVEEDTDAAAETVRTALKLYRCSDESGTCRIVQEKEGPLRQTDLVSSDSFIVDNGSRGIWVWVGKRATPEERRQAMANAQGFVAKKGYPRGTSVIRVIDGAEPVEFKMLFSDWRDPRASVPFNRQYSLSRIAPTVNNKFDASTLHSSPALSADTQLVDDGTGDLTVWRLHEKELEPVPPEHFGVFFDGDCYLLHYSYLTGSKKSHILYYWLGAHSSQDERGTIAWHTVKLDDTLGGAAVQVRVIQGKEPPQFLNIFNGKMIIFNGGYASSFDGPEAMDLGFPTEFLLQVRGGDSYNTRAVQVELRAAALNSNDVFVLAKNTGTYVWCGKGSTGDERERAKAIASQWAKAEAQVVSEGQEKADFWQAFPMGREPYANDDRLKDVAIRVPARLFQCSNAYGVFKAEEIVDFSQNDLVQDDIMVLDVGTAIFIWVGRGANKEERLSVGKLVYEYLESDPRGRDMDTPLIQIQQEHEPPNFTGFFGAWDPNAWDESNYDDVRGQLDAIRITTVQEAQSKPKNLPTYPLHVLRLPADKLPEDVDPLFKELHLSDEDFVQVLGMSKEDFGALPLWRKANFKKAGGIF